MAKPAVTVLIPTYNRARFLPECLDSVLDQTLPPAQVLVVNDGSTDNTSSILVSYRDRIEYIETPNKGKPAALNLAMPRARGDYVWIFDDDDVALPDALERFAGALEQRPDCAFSYSSCYIFKSRAADGRVEVERECEMEEIREEEFLVRFLENNFLRGPCFFVRAACYRNVGPFREDLIRSQDYEMVIRLSRKYRGVRVGGPTFYYRQHEGLRGSSHESFSAARKIEKWREFNRKIFRELRQELGLHEYLPSGLGSEELGPSDTRRAYLQRMTIMSLKGLYDEMIEDLGLALAQKVESYGLSTSERLLITRATSYAAADDSLLTGSNVLRRVDALCWDSAAGREAHFDFLRGIYWGAHYAWTNGAFRHAFRSLLTFVRCAGFTGIARALHYKLTRLPGVDSDSTQNL